LSYNKKKPLTDLTQSHINSEHVETNTSQKKSLNNIREPVEGHLSEFKAFYKDALKTDVFLLDQIVRYLLRQKGKKLRPTLVFLTARMFGEINNRSYIAATMIELLHAATLIHDDVVDGADKRRGFLSINKVWKNKASVLLGDFLLSRGLLIALDNDEFKLLKVLSKAVKSMSEGELRQLKASKLLNMTEERYFKIISEKTASLIAACCECGAISTTDDENIHEKMHDIGIKLGIAFQIRDDLFDYGIDDVGKPKHNDIKDRKITLPLIKAFEEASKTDQWKMRRLLKRKNKSKEDISSLVTLVNKYEGISYAKEMMVDYAEEAKKELENLQQVNNKQNFKELVDYIITRKK